MIINHLSLYFFLCIPDFRKKIIKMHIVLALFYFNEIAARLVFSA